MRGATAATTLILAYLLGPAEYGLVALAMVIASMIFVGNFGLTAAAVQHGGYTDRRVLDIAWTADKLVFNTMFAAAMLLGADVIAGWFDAPDVAPVVRILALVPILRTIENNALIVFTRRLDYRSRFLLEVSESLTTLMLVVPLAFLWQNVWAYIVAYVVGAAVRAITSYVLYPRAPRPFFEGRLARQLFRFGKWMVGLRVLELAREQLATLVVAAALGPTSLAFFHLGSRFSLQLIADFYQTGHKVLFPIYARIQHDVARMARGYETIVTLTALVVAPITAFSIALAAPIIELVLGGEWLPAADVVQLLAVAGFVRIVVGTSHPLFRGKGHGGAEFAQNLVYFATLLPGVLILSNRYGFTGAAAAVLLAEALQLPLWVWLIRRTIAVPMRRVLAPIALAAVAATAAVAAQGAVIPALGGFPAILRIVAAFLIGLLVYLSIAGFGLHLHRIGGRTGLSHVRQTLRDLRPRKPIETKPVAP